MDLSRIIDNSVRTQKLYSIIKLSLHVDYQESMDYLRKTVSRVRGTYIDYLKW